MTGGVRRQICRQAQCLHGRLPHIGAEVLLVVRLPDFTGVQGLFGCLISSINDGPKLRMLWYGSVAACVGYDAAGERVLLRIIRETGELAELGYAPAWD